MQPQAAVCAARPSGWSRPVKGRFSAAGGRSGQVVVGGEMRALFLWKKGDDSGMTTAEYAVGTVAACGFGGVLYKVLTSDAVIKLLTDILRRALTLSF
jgi:hypothetical protein